MKGAPAAGEDIWVFAYGSLIWQPDFEFVESRKARLYGWHRSMCILSHYYRGTQENPGLVLGLNPGGSCVGVAYRVVGVKWPMVRQALHDRELINGVYEPRFQMVCLEDGRKTPAYIFTADRTHDQYWTGPIETAVSLIERGIGLNGTARDYFLKTLEKLAALDISDKGLTRLKKAITLKAEILKDGAA